MRLKDLCSAAGIKCPKKEALREIRSIVTDSKDAEENSLFVCIRGLHTDGHTYIADAIKRGCRCVLTESGCEYESYPDVLYLRTENTRRTAAYLYHAWNGFPCRQLKMIGVTGTNGKTSVTHMIRAILEEAGHPCVLIGTVGCEFGNQKLDAKSKNALANMTTPDPEVLYRILAEAVNAGAEYAVMEVSSHALALGKVAPIEFTLSVFTNLTPEHLDFHQTMKDYAKAKAALFERSKRSILNCDSPYGAYMAVHTDGHVVRCSQAVRADCYADNVSLFDSETAYTMHVGTQSIPIVCPIPGEFCVMNSMQAAIAAIELGVPVKTVQKALQEMECIQGRMERIDLGEVANFTVLIDYAHTPDALETLLKTARRFQQKGQGRLVILFGCGGDRDRTKRPVMGAIAANLADLVILTSDNSRSEDPNEIIKEILSGMPQKSCVRVIVDRRDAIRYAIANARENDLILLAGKGHEEYEIGMDGKRPFCEKEIVKEAFQQGWNKTMRSSERKSDR